LLRFLATRFLALTLKTTEVKGKRYVIVFADDFSEWKEFAIYTATDEKIEEIVRKIQALVEKAEDDPQYDPVPEIAAMIVELIDTFIIGEIPEEAGICSEDEYVAYPEEDERSTEKNCKARCSRGRARAGAGCRRRRLVQGRNGGSRSGGGKQEGGGGDKEHVDREGGVPLRAHVLSVQGDEARVHGAQRFGL